MSDFAAQTADIRQLFDAAWIALDNSISHFFDGETVPIADLKDQTWVRMSVLLGDTLQVSMGGGTTGKRIRNIGVASVQIFKPPGTGYGELYRLADNVASIWQVSTIDGIVFRATSAQPVQVDETWVMLPVFTPFHVDDYVT